MALSLVYIYMLESQKAEKATSLASVLRGSGACQVGQALWPFGVSWGGGLAVWWAPGDVATRPGCSGESAQCVCTHNWPRSEQCSRPHRVQLQRPWTATTTGWTPTACRLRWQACCGAGYQRCAHLRKSHVQLEEVKVNRQQWGGLSSDAPTEEIPRA
jgi:hypothetical protein